MKNLFIIFSLCLSTSLFANDQEVTCYKATSAIPDFLSSQFCFEKAKIDLEAGAFFPGSNSLPFSLSSVNLTAIDLKTYFFNTKFNLLDEHLGTCEEMKFAEISLSGLVLKNGDVDENSLFILVDYKKMHDSCHSRLEFGQIEYRKID